jgi:hypothetical protein
MEDWIGLQCSVVKGWRGLLWNETEAWRGLQCSEVYVGLERIAM